MISVHIDLPIFSSPTQPLGYFNGVVQLPSAPRPREPFPWPLEWLARHQEVFDGEPMQVWGEPIEWPYPPATIHVTMYGLVCRDRDHARDVAQHIERCSGIIFSDHD